MMSVGGWSCTLCCILNNASPAAENGWRSLGWGGHGSRAQTCGVCSFTPVALTPCCWVERQEALEWDTGQHAGLVLSCFTGFSPSLLKSSSPAELWNAPFLLCCRSFCV